MHYTAEDLAVRVVLVQAPDAVAEQLVLPAVDLTSAVAVSAAEVTSAVSFGAFAAGSVGWGFSASFHWHPGDQKVWGPSDCRNPWS